MASLCGFEARSFSVVHRLGFKWSPDTVIPALPCARVRTRPHVRVGVLRANAGADGADGAAGGGKVGRAGGGA